MARRSPPVRRSAAVDGARSLRVRDRSTVSFAGRSSGGLDSSFGWRVLACPRKDNRSVQIYAQSGGAHMSDSTPRHPVALQEVVYRTPATASVVVARDL